MINAVIIDDEPKNISTLQKIITDFTKEVCIVATAQNIQDGKEIIERLNPQLVFLDVEMPNGSGFDLLNDLNDIRFEIIFVTAYNQYAVDAFRYASIDYLLKPVNITSLLQAVERAKHRIEEKIFAQQYLLLKDNLKAKHDEDKRISITDNNEQHYLLIKEICYCVADGSYTFIHMQNKKRYHVSKSLKEFEMLLPEDLFFRIHHGYLVNVKNVLSVKKGRTGIVQMSDGAFLEIAARRKNDFLVFMNNK